MSSRKRNANRDYMIESDDEEFNDNESNNDDDDDNDNVKNKKNDDSDSGSDTEDETVDAKRIRLAREYLDKIKKGDDEDNDKDNNDDTSTSYESTSDEDDDDSDTDHVGKRLAKDRLVKEGTYNLKIADKIQSELDIENVNKISYWSKNAHDLSPTCINLNTSGSYAYSGSKDHSVIMWDVERQCVNGVVLPQWKKNKKRWDVNNNDSDEESVPRNNGEVLAVASSDDGRYLATGGRDSLVKIFDIRLVDKSCNDKALVHTFKGHKKAITCLSFRANTLQLFSGSNDRTIRHYNLEQNFQYIETLYGHQENITSISCYNKNIPISTSRDRTVRAWKLNQETHCIYRGGKNIYSSDCITHVNHYGWFITGHENGCINLWNMSRKKPVGYAWHHDNSQGKGIAGTEKEIVSCNVLKGSDLGITGSYDGYLKLWKLRTGKKSADRGIDSIGSIPIKGYINAIAIESKKAKFCLVAVGQEHRLGRWNRVKGAKNRIGIVPLRNANTSDQNATTTSDQD